MEDKLKYIANKITCLRIEKGISERQLSLELGHSPSYINGITSCKKLPSLNELLYIIEYFNISVQDFFNESNSMSLKRIELLELTNNLNDQDYELLINIIKRFKSV